MGGLLLVLFFIVGLTILYAYIEAHSIRLVRYDIVDEDIPESFDNTQIVFISDIHCDKYFTRKDLKELVGRINDLNPDVVILGGDYVSGYRNIDSLLCEIGNLKSKYGVYTVLGNHDHWTRVPHEIQSGFLKAGFHICDNKSYWINNGKDSIKIGGVGDLWSAKQDQEQTIHDVSQDDFCILISHQPDYIEQVDNKYIDLLLSGHTHGGQITFFGLWAPLMPGATRRDLKTTSHEYTYGWVEKNGVKLYVTSGIGMGGFPFRFFAPPEIVLFTLKK